MIQAQTLLTVMDNSGGKLVRCLKILKKGAKTRYGKIGDVVVVSVQKIRSKNKLTSKVKKGDVVYGVIVKTKHRLKRKSGSTICFEKNSVVLLNKQLNPFATRVFGVIPKELRTLKFLKIASLAGGVV
jgi:large subunit ribosomal protein L14